MTIRSGERRAAFRDISWGWETYIAIICGRIGLRGCREEGCYFHYLFRFYGQAILNVLEALYQLPNLHS
jgi:hypothetical protein